jgi:hypothetical protein
MKRRYWIITICFAIAIIYYAAITIIKLKDYLLLSKQQHRIEQNAYGVFQTLNQYNRLFGTIPSSFSNQKLKTLLKENNIDTLILNLNPKIISDSVSMLYHVYLNGPDGKDDSLKTIINADYIPTNTKILNLSFLRYISSKGDINLGSSSYVNVCSEKSRYFTCIDRQDNIMVENDSIRTVFYHATNEFINRIVEERNLKPEAKVHLAFCNIKFENGTANCSVICVKDSNNETIVKFMNDLANYLKGIDLGVKEVYFPIIINNALISVP